MEDYLETTIQTYNWIAAKYISSTKDRQPQSEFIELSLSVTPNGLILDAGCGGGRDCQAFVRKGFKAIGIDLSAKMLELARSSVKNCVFVQADVRNIPLPDDHVDGIWCCASLLHLKRSEMPKALAEFWRVLKTNAVCSILVKEGSGEEFVQDELSLGMPRFYTYFRENEMRQLCLSLNFKILSSSTTPEQGNHIPGRRNHGWLCLLIQKT